MFFQVPNSPKNPQKKEKPKTCKEEAAVLKLAPFTPIPKICFENILIGEETIKKLSIENPNGFNNKLKITKIPPVDRHVNLSWTETEVEANGNAILEIIWTPKEEGGWRDTISVVDCRNVKRDIPIIFKSIPNKKGKKRPKAKPSIVAKTIKSPLKKFSPKTTKKKRSPFKVPIENQKPPKIYFDESNKENTSPFRNAIEHMNFSYTKQISFSEKLNKLEFQSPTNYTFNFDSTTTLRRDTYNMNNKPLNDSIDEFNDSLECEKLFDDIKFDSPILKENNLLKKLNNTSFTFSDNIKIQVNDEDITNNTFKPNNCSTEQKNPPMKYLTANPKELFKSNNTYDLNDTAETCNLSGGTFTIENTSTTSTYSFCEPSNLSRICTSSPVMLNLNLNINENINSNYLNFSGVNAKAALSCITEEDLNYDTFNKSSNKKRKQDETLQEVFNISPPKRPFIKPKTPEKPKLNWSKKCNKIRQKSIANLKLNLTKNKTAISNVTTTIKKVCEIDPFLIAAMYDKPNDDKKFHEIDPFIASSLYYDDTWLDKQINELKKWLNALLTPPSELETSAEIKKIDVAKIWQDCAKKELIYAPTKEKISLKYHTSHKLEHLRKKAIEMFHSNEMTTVLSKITVTLENKMLVMREDKNLHLDVGLQAEIMMLLLCYNPLWLRIGLETIYNEKIPLESNSDVIGLSTFILLRFFHNPDFSKNHTVVHNKYLPGYATRIKKYTLKKFLMLVYFLDYAKTQKLIAHDPCLFCRDAPIKESRELLVAFARELISAIGDITKFLRRYGYEVVQKQNYIDEFDYAVKNLGVDLRDGIRLTKVMEIILLRNDLTAQLRGPAISRLQKLHNVKVAMDSLKNANYQIAGDITPKDIVDGHREKTLSLLWQIIYKFQAPKFIVAASKLQKWWRSLQVQIKLRILNKPRKQRQEAAIKIQRYYRGYVEMKKARDHFQKIRKSTIIIQNYFKSVLCRVKYLKTKQTCIAIQRKFRANQVKQKYTNYKNTVIQLQLKIKATIEMKKQRKLFLKQKESAIIIQNKFRAWILMKQQRKQYLQLKYAVVIIEQRYLALIAMRNAREHYLNIREAIVKIQRKFRAYLLMRKDLLNYLITREAIIVIQQQFRANKAMIICRENYLQLRNSCIIIQEYFRANKSMQQQRKYYLQLKDSTIKMQRLFRAKREMKICRLNYLTQQKYAIVIQQQFRAMQLMKLQRKQYLQQKQAITIIQNKWRAIVLMRKYRNEYLELRETVIMLQQHYRANVEMKKERENYLKIRGAVCILQERFRANVAMKEARHQFIEIRKATIIIQQRYRALVQMKLTRKQFIRQKVAASLIQERLRATLLMRIVRKEYLIKREAVRIIQTKYRAYLLMKQTRQEYLIQKEAAIKIQRKLRATLLMKTVRQEYLTKIKAARIIQNKFRAYLLMQQTRKNYLQQKEATIKIQRKLRATLLMRIERNEYLIKLKAARIIQNKFRGYLLMKQTQLHYLLKREACIILQQRFRAKLVMRIVRNEYLTKLIAVRSIQAKFKAYLLMKEIRQNYLLKKKSTIIIQRKFRATMLMKNARHEYLTKLEAIKIIQNKFKSYLIMKQLCNEFNQLKQATIIIQKRFKATILMKTARQEYLTKLKAIQIIQTKYRAYTLMKQTRKNYLKQKEAVIKIQRKLRATILMKTVRHEYLTKLKAVQIIQTKYRAHLLMRETRNNYLIQKEAAIKIQQKLRATILMRTARNEYLVKRVAVLRIQEKFKAYLLMRETREKYLHLRKTVITIQRRFKATLLMQTVRHEYLVKLDAARIIQDKFRATLIMKELRHTFLMQKEGAIKIQQWFRATLQMKKARSEYLAKLEAIQIIQNKFRFYLLMKDLRQIYLIKKEAVTKIQQWFRATHKMKIARQQYLEKKEAVRIIQTRLRAYLLMRKEQQNYINTKKAVIIIQQRFRAKILMKTVRQEYLSTLEATRIIQTKFKAYLLMKQLRETYINKRNITINIQRKFRALKLMQQQRKIYLQQIHATIKIQQWYRNIITSKKQREEFLRMKNAVTVIQKHFRNYLVMKQIRIQYLTYKLSVIKIQTYYRHYLIMKKERSEFLIKKRAAIKIQSWSRMVFAKKLLAKMKEDAKDTEEKRLERRLNKAAVKIQAAWRGYKTRSVEDSSITTIRQRTKDAARNASPELTMGQRNNEAIELLIYQTSMKEIIRALRILDFTTRLFPNACIKVVDLIVSQLYLLLANTNRSVPDMEAGGLCISILINLYKFGPTSKPVWRIDYIDTLLSSLLHWSDKEAGLFNNLCTLIWLFAQNPEYCKVILTTENASKLLLKTYQQCERKQKMLSKMKNTNNSINTNINNKYATKQLKSNTEKDKLNASKVTKPINYIPSLHPDWGIINIKRPRTFQNPLFAIKCLLKKLNM